MFPTYKSSQTPLKGQYSWHNGTLVFCYFTKAQEDRFVGNGTIAGMFGFLDYLNENNIPKNTNIKVIRRLYHLYNLENVLQILEIDMQPATEPAISKDNFRVLTALKLVSTSVLLVTARKLFKKVAGGFFMQKIAR